MNVLLLWLLQVVPKTFRPEWKESFHILVEDALHEMLIFEVWDHHTFHDVSMDIN
jgi:Ca2+-dependent lipid-binding protein